MAGTRDAILDALEELTADELKKFKLKLQNAPLREGYSHIPRGALQRMDAVDLADRLVSCYLDAYATELTAQLLSDMGMQEAAEQLQARSRARGEPLPLLLRSPPPSPTPFPGLFRFPFLLPP